uniref:V-set and transmembrane domain containing 2 like n=1 Tax=Sinocyclocheilus grahami TaxID=75366 RepID=A0A672N6Z2_SINGR
INYIVCPQMCLLNYLQSFMQLICFPEHRTVRPLNTHNLKNVCFSSALFTEVPQDMISQAGDDVEMACSFRGASSSSVSLEIQWWYTRDWAEQPSWTTNQESLYLFVVSQENKPKGATKISVVKVVGSNISHKLRLSSVRPSDEGTYECRVTDFSESRAQQHRVQAYLQVQPDLQQEHQTAETREGEFSCGAESEMLIYSLERRDRLNVIYCLCW